MIDAGLNEILRYVVHYGLHLFLPGLVAWVFFRSQWKRAWLIMLATMLVDLDHLFADPIFQANRCSIGFHPLHSYYAIGGYGIMTIFYKIRIIGVGLILHMITDFTDCLWMGADMAG
jgi:hypothetical protein